MRVLIDGDSCYVLDMVVVLSRLMNFDVVVFAVSEATTRHIDYKFTLCELGPDSADNVIVEQMEAGDVIITDDNLLAYRCMERGGKVLSNSGLVYDLADFVKKGDLLKNTHRNKSRKEIVGKYLDFIKVFFELMGYTPPTCIHDGTIHIFRLGFNKDQRIIRKRAIAVAAYFGYKFRFYTRSEKLAQRNPDFAVLLPNNENKNLDLVAGFKKSDVVVTSENYFASKVLALGARAINHEGYVFNRRDYHKSKKNPVQPVKSLNKKQLHEGKFCESLISLLSSDVK
ncbi:MAG: DUF188 domain-containing protein [Turicibacter sp.]|nr:DUF188 domain-containing protein [Turicibacter sp.]